jgi:membrane protease YdiL (CAAX protease family)
MKSLGKIGDLLVVILAVTFIPKLASALTNKIHPFVSSLDPDKTFLLISIHHIFQLLFTLVLMKLWVSRNLSDYGFNLKNRKLSIQLFLWFCLIYLVPMFLVNVLPNIIDSIPPWYSYPLNTRNVVGTLSFQYLFSGTCEEPLFRAFVIVVLSQSWKKVFKVWWLEISAAGLIATVLFMYAHIKLTIFPFEITYISWWQQVWALGLGIYYAVVFQKTKSLLCPILSHNYLNGIIYTVRYVMAFLMK